MTLPTRSDIAARRVQLFKEQILGVVEDEDLDLYLALVQELAEESGHDMAEIAAGAAWLARRDKPLVATMDAAPLDEPDEDGMVRLYIDAGRSRGVRPSDVVGAIANEAGIPGRVIGAIDIYDEFTLVDVPAEYKQQVLGAMAGAKMRNQPVSIRVAKPGMEDSEHMSSAEEAAPRRTPRPRPPSARAAHPSLQARSTTQRPGATRPGAAASAQIQTAVLTNTLWLVGTLTCRLLYAATPRGPGRFLPTHAKSSTRTCPESCSSEMYG